MKIKILLCILLAEMLLVFSCDPIIDPVDPPVVVDPAGYTTIKFKGDDTGYVKLYTNDPGYTANGKTFWTAGNVSQDEGTYNVEIEAKKVSGSQDAGFGLILCVQEEIDCFIMIQISVSGYYMIGKVVDGRPRTPFINDWERCEDIKTNLNETNKIRVAYNETDSKFDLFINDNPVCNFIDNGAEPYYTDGRWGFIAEVSSLDDLPYVPVDVRFKDLTP